MTRAFLGICTLNRLDYLRAILESFQQTASHRMEWVVAVADDGSSDGSGDFLRSQLKCRVIDMVAWNSCAGVCRQKNCLLALANAVDADVTFLADDDIVFRRTGWDVAYMAAMQATGFGHLIHFDEAWARRQGAPDAGGAPIRWTVPVQDAQGAFLTLSRAARLAVGYFDERNFWGRGWGHRDFTHRLVLAGQHPAHMSADHVDGPRLLGLQPRQTYVQSVLREPGTEAFWASVAADEQARRKRVIESRTQPHLGIADALDPAHHTQLQGTGSHWALCKSEIAASGLGVEVKSSPNEPTEAWVINLDRDRERWRVMQAWRSHGLALRRIAAVDGTSAEILSEWRTYSEDPNWTDFDRRLGRRAISSPGALAYIHTWRRLIAAARSERRRHVLVMDDDTIPHIRYESMVNAAIHELPADWMLLYLGFTPRPDHPPVPATPNLCHPMASVDGSFAVMVSSCAYAPLLELLDSELAPVDAGALRELDRRNPTRVFALRVPAVIADVTTSSIRGPRDMAAHARKARWDLDRYQHRMPTSAQPW
jgi:hypothetical protein